jgi:hypothetical protein
MEVINRIHFDPAVGDAEILKQLSGNRRRVSKQRIKVCCVA